jgi:hypothetical protein
VLLRKDRLGGFGDARVSRSLGTLLWGHDEERIMYRRYKCIRGDQEACAKCFTVESLIMLGSLRPLLSLKQRLSLFEEMETFAWVSGGRVSVMREMTTWWWKEGERLGRIREVVRTYRQG